MVRLLLAAQSTKSQGLRSRKEAARFYSFFTLASEIPIREPLLDDDDNAMTIRMTMTMTTVIDDQHSTSYYVDTIRHTAALVE